MTKALTVSPAAQKAVAKFDGIALEAQEAYEVALRAGKRDTLTMMKIAKGIDAMHKSCDENVSAMLIKLQNEELGFLTDKPDGYQVDVLKKVYVQARIRGLSPFANEYNIISGKLYVTQGGWLRLLHELPGLTDLKTEAGDVEIHGDTAKVEYVATWKYHNKTDSQSFVKKDTHDGRITVKVNKGMGIDGAKGKALARLLKTVYYNCMGTADPSDVADSFGTEELSPAQMDAPPDGALFATVAEVPE